MSILYISEKPSQARDIAAVLGIRSRGNGYIELNNGDKVTWAIGHLLEQAAPEEHNPAWGGSWNWGQLPMIPETWKYEVVDKTKSQFKVIQGLLKSVRHVVIATDAGREGELIARELLDYCRWRGKIERLWTSSLVASDIKAALARLRPDSETYPLYEAALARQHSDNMYGFSGTRAATLAARQPRMAFPLGRVQTPTLAMVVRRDLAIAGFASRAYYELKAEVRTRSGKTFTMMHAPGPENRILVEADAKKLMAQAAKAQGPLKVAKTKGSEGAPLAFSLPALQKEANSALGFTARNTLTLAQALYDKKIITYPRTDCPYLAESQVAEVADVLANVSRRFPKEVAAVRSSGIVTRGSTFNNAKLTDHHGIVPTTVSEPLEGAELQLYTLICQRYLQLLSPDCLFDSVAVQMDANGVLFKAGSKTVTSPGWKSVKLL